MNGGFILITFNTNYFMEFNIIQIHLKNKKLLTFILHMQFKIQKHWL